MKKQILFFINFWLFSLSTVQAQNWVASPTSKGLLPNGYAVFGIKVVDNNVVWAVASRYPQTLTVPADHIIKILKTTNAGQSWRVIDVIAATGRISFDIQAFDSTTAWITAQDLGSGLGRGLLKTSDGGLTWSWKLVHRAGGVFLRFFDRQNGVAINNNLTAYTSNGGDNWTIDSTSINLVADEYTVLYTGTNKVATIGDTVWFGTTKGRIFRSVNKGKNWESFTSVIPSTWAINSLAFKDVRNGILIAADDATDAFKGLAKTNDGGKTWQFITNVPTQISSLMYPVIAAVGKNTNAYVIGLESNTQSITFLTRDDGNTWTPLTDDFGSWGAIEFLSPQVGWLGAGTIANALTPAMYRWNAEKLFTSIKALPNEPLLSISPNPSNGNFVLDWQTVENFSPQYLRIVDMMGKIVYEKTGFDVGLKTQNIDFQHLMNGIYFIQLKSKDEIVAKKIVVER